jgi:predicted short-subunit dehydrogenase-like oxidoreductase (DUF2520 family)
LPRGAAERAESPPPGPAAGRFAGRWRRTYCSRVEASPDSAASADRSADASGGDRPLAGLTVAVAGTGRVGTSLGHWLLAGGARLAAIGFHRDERAARELAGIAQAAGAERPRVVPLPALASAGCDLLLVAVADPALDAVVARLAVRPQAPVVLHVAGSRGASALAPLAGRGSAVGTLHPLKAFPRPLPDPAAARGVLFAVDGDAAAAELAERLARAWGGVPRTVEEAARPLYHLGATLAAGGVVTLLAAAERIAAAAGLPREVLAGYLELSRGALAAAGDELAAGGAFAGAVTGPAARGDRDTTLRQLRRLAAARPELAELAAVVAREALAAREEAGGLGAAQRELLDCLREATRRAPAADAESASTVAGSAASCATLLDP